MVSADIHASARRGEPAAFSNDDARWERAAARPLRRWRVLLCGAHHWRLLPAILRGAAAARKRGFPCHRRHSRAGRLPVPAGGAGRMQRRRTCRRRAPLPRRRLQRVCFARLAADRGRSRCLRLRHRRIAQTFRWRRRSLASCYCGRAVCRRLWNSDAAYTRPFRNIAAPVASSMISVVISSGRSWRSR